MNFDTGSFLHFHFPKELVEKLQLSYNKTGKTITGKRAYTTFEIVEATLNQDIMLGNTILDRSNWRST